MNNTALDLGSAGRDNIFGYGLVQAAADELENGGTTPLPNGIALTGNGYKNRGNKFVDLSWSGNEGNVDIYRGGSLIASNVSGSTYSENLGKGGGGSYTYQVCESGTSICSSSVTVSF